MCCEPELPKVKFWFSLISLGCAKNLVDSQWLLGKVFEFGRFKNVYDIRYFAEPYDEQVEYVFVNTCGFLSTARQEMLDVIASLLSSGKKVFVLGCGLKYFAKLEGKLPDVLADPNVAFLDWGDIEHISVLDLVNRFSKKQIKGEYVFPATSRAYTNLAYGFEYLKIAEGCSNQCSFCIIPKIR